MEVSYGSRETDDESMSQKRCSVVARLYPPLTSTTTMSKASQPELKKVSSPLHLANSPFILIPFAFLVYGQEIVRPFAGRPQGQRDIARLRPFPQSSHR